MASLHLPNSGTKQKKENQKDTSLFQIPGGRDTPQTVGQATLPTSATSLSLVGHMSPAPEPGDQ
jgi:hypothetical protein